MAAAAQELPKKPHFVFPEQASNIQQIPSKSNPNVLCKTLIILVLLIVIPLFPSQAPDFISQNIFTEFWEIIHLLFIGIAVSYGLFGRRTSQMVPEKVVDSGINDSNAYLSEISHLYSIFDDGYENLSGPDEQDVMQSYDNCECSQRNGNHFFGKDRCAIHGDIKFRSSSSNYGSENICDGNGKNVNQAWCSLYVKGESLVVVSNGKYLVGGSSDFKPLNLPIRSLRPRAADNDMPELKNRNESSPETESNNDVKVVKIRGAVPLNLEKFGEAIGKSSIFWRSRSGRMENGEEMNNRKVPAHCRPHSVGEFDFERLKSGSISGSKLSGSPESASSKVEKLKRKTLFTVPKIALLNAEASSSDAKTRPFSIGASADMNGLGDLEKQQENFGNRSEEEVGKGKQAIKSSDVDRKSSGLAKVLSKAKSVRTIKTKRYIMNQKEHLPSQIDNDGNLRRMGNNSEADSLVKRGRGEKPGNPPANHQIQESDRIFLVPKPKPTLPEFFNEEKQDTDDRNVTEPEEDAQSKFDKSSDEDDSWTNIDNDQELEGSEVDRKAGEFIAKFREQIRLQKTLSMEGYSGW